MSESHSLSISEYIDGLRVGDERAAQKVWEFFYERLVRLAAQRLAATPTKAADEEDVVQEATAQFFRLVQKGKFPQLNDRFDLWQVLAMLVTRRVIDQQRKGLAEKHGGGKVATESILFAQGISGSVGGLDALKGAEPTPEFAEDLFRLLCNALGELPGEPHRAVATLKLQGYRNREIAEQLGVSRATVERRLADIRALWGPER